MVARLAEEDRAEPKDAAARELVARGERIAYFSAEFGLTEILPIYAGGLGILAGDLLKSASDLGVPMTGVGLFYREGYFRQVLSERGTPVRGVPRARARRAAALDRRDARRQPARGFGEPRRAEREPPDPDGQGGPRSAPAPRLEPSGKRRSRPRGHRPSLRRRPRDAPPAGDRAGHRRLARPREAPALADDSPHQRGPRGLRVPREDPPARAGREPDVRRGPRSRDQRKRLHDAHARPRGHRRLHAGASLEILRRLRQRARHLLRRVLRSRPRGRGGGAGALLDGGPRDAPLDAPERRLEAARRRLAAALAQCRAGSAALRDPDHPDHQRRARRDLDGARDRADGRRRDARGRRPDGALAGPRGPAREARGRVPRKARRGEAAPGRPRGRHRRGGPRPGSQGPHDRFRPALRDVQAGDAPLPRAQAPGVPAPPDRPPRADSLRRQGPPPRRGRQGVSPRRRDGRRAARSSGDASSSCPTTTWGSPALSSRDATSG